MHQLFLVYSSEGAHLPQQKETANGSMPGDDSLSDNLARSAARDREMVISSSSATSTIDGNVATSSITFHHNHNSDDEDSKERKRKAMDHFRKVSTNNSMTSLYRIVCACKVCMFTSVSSYSDA